ncbi:MAG: peptide ABC transporter substrate-binding protein [Planctomycetota bacterium]
MVQRFLLGCAAFLVAVVSLYSATTREPRADFTYVNLSDIHTLDPARMSWTPDFRVALNLWEGLTTWHPETLEPVSAAAIGPPAVSNDGLIHTFTLRTDARWSNGDPVSAWDFVRGWRRGLEPGTATDYVFLFTDHFEGVAEYVDWRRRGAKILTALSRLSEGWAIEEDQAHALRVKPFTDWIHAAGLELNLNSAGKYGSAQSHPWAAIHRRAHQEHAAEMDKQFSQVGFVALDDQSFQVRLKGPCPYLLDLLALPMFLPCHSSIENLRESWNDSPITREGLFLVDPQWTKPDCRTNGYPGLVSNGPYRLQDWTFKRRARLAVNPHHRNASRITCRTVDMVVYDNANTALMAYEAGHVDLLPDLSVPYDHELARLSMTGARPDFHLCHVLATYFLNFNCASDSHAGHPNPFLDVRVRKAFALAVDKEALVNQVRGRGDRVATSLVPQGGFPGYSPPLASPHDFDAARRLLAEAGFPDGIGLPPIEFLVTHSDGRVCQSLAHMWQQQLNVRVELVSKETKTFAEDKADRRFLIARGNWYADYLDPTTFLDLLVTNNGNNDSGYSSDLYDGLLHEARQTKDADRRRELLALAETRIIRDDFPILPLFHFAEPIAIKPYVQGLIPNPRLWFPFQFARVER